MPGDGICGAALMDCQGRCHGVLEGVVPRITDEFVPTEDSDSDTLDLEGIFLMGEGRDMSTETLVNLFSNLLKDEDSGHTVGTSLANIANELHTFNHNFKKYVHHISKK